VGHRAGLDTEVRGKILCLCWGSNPGRPVCSQIFMLIINTNINLLFKNSDLQNTAFTEKLIIAKLVNKYSHIL
jgi:hypothetical protein